MDEMKIQSDWTKAIITKIIGKLIKSKLGVDPKINLGDIYVSIGETNAEIAFAGSVTVEKSELYGLIKKLL